MDSYESNGALGGAAQGAAVGTMIAPGIGTAIGAGLGGLVGGMSGKGGSRAARAASRAAQEREQFMRGVYNNVNSISGQMTTSALLNYDKALGAADRNISRQEEMVKQIDPTILEASQQALKLLKGRSSSVLNPLMNQRNLQRQQLVNTLRQQMGPGAETSSAGQQALNRFDMETNSMTAQAQQGALSTLQNTYNTFSGAGRDLNTGITLYGNLTGARADVQNNQIRNLMGAAQGLAPTLGSSHVGEMMAGQNQQNTFNQLLNAGTSMGMMYGLQGMGAAAGGASSGANMTANANPAATGQMFNYNLPGLPP